VNRGRVGSLGKGKGREGEREGIKESVNRGRKGGEGQGGGVKKKNLNNEALCTFIRDCVVREMEFCDSSFIYLKNFCYLRTRTRKCGHTSNASKQGMQMEESIVDQSETAPSL